MPANASNPATSPDPKLRFSDRVEDYARYRPGYPPEIIDLLRTECNLTPESVVADVGSGTGFLTRLFLENGNVVYAVEPNAAMREAGERLLINNPKFHSVTGSAEATTLPDASVDFITAGQAFHWFDAARTRAEFLRVLLPHGWVAIVWNERKTDSTPFLRDYETLLRTYGTDYGQVASTYLGSRYFVNFFGADGLREKSFPNEQIFDFDGLKGRLMSSSYAPRQGQPNHSPMLAELRRIFDAHQKNGRVRFEYETQVFYGHLRPATLGAAESR